MRTLTTLQDDVQETELPDLSLLEGKKVNKLGKIVDEEVKHIQTSS
jgi:hypothetical protein